MSDLLGFDRLGNTLVEPLRTTPARKLAAPCLRCLLAFVSQGEVTALVLRVVSLSGGIALRLLQVFLHGRIWTKFERVFPGTYGLLGSVGGELDVSQDGERVG